MEVNKSWLIKLKAKKPKIIMLEFSVLIDFVEINVLRNYPKIRQT